MKLEKLADGGVVVLNADDTLNRAIQHMWRLNIRHLPVVRHGVPVGMVSERDVLRHTCWPDDAAYLLDDGRPMRLSGATRVDKIMTSPLVVLSPEDPVEKAARLMLHKRISAVPLANIDTIVGIVTETDFLRCFTEDRWLIPGPSCRQTAVVDQMSTNVFSVEPRDATLTAIRLMRDKQVRHVAVVQDGSLHGIISDRDVLRGGPREVGQQPVSVTDLHIEHHLEVRGIMTTHLEVIGFNATLADAAGSMVTHKIGATPVVEQGRLVGIITESDLLRAYVRDCEA